MASLFGGTVFTLGFVEILYLGLAVLSQPLLNSRLPVAFAIARLSSPSGCVLTTNGTAPQNLSRAGNFLPFSFGML